LQLTDIMYWPALYQSLLPDANVACHQKTSLFPKHFYVKMRAVCSCFS